MPIIATEPISGGPFGPGFTVHVTTDLVGPIDPSSYWIVSVWDSANETEIEESSQILVSQQISDHQMFYWWNKGIDGNYMPFPPLSALADGKNVRVRIQLNDPTGEVIETTNFPVVWDTRSAVPFILGQIQANTGGNATMAADVATIKAASFATFGSQLVPISQLLQSPPIGLLVRELIGDLEGEGTLTRPEGPFNVNAFGLAWEVVAAGEGIGVDEGAPDTLFTHMLDLQLVHQLADANNETTSIASFDYGDAMWLFNPMLPHEVKYWIGPSVTLRMYWLLVV